MSTEQMQQIVDQYNKYARQYNRIASGGFCEDTKFLCFMLDAMGSEVNRSSDVEFVKYFNLHAIEV